MLPAKIDFVCLKWGTKYTSEFVNKLDNMISRNVSVPYQLHCMTEDPTGIKPNIEIIPLPDLPLNKWWWKMLLFDENFPINDGIFLDLDIIIQSDITFLYQPRYKMNILHTNWIDLAEQKKWTIGDNYKYCSVNSSLMCWNKYTNRHFIWEDFINNREKIMFLYKGIDNWLESRHKTDIDTYAKDQTHTYSYWTCDEQYRENSSIILFDYNTKKQDELNEPWIKKLWQ
mgnify:FL=1